MKNLPTSIVIVYVAFFAMILGAIYLTSSAFPLFALLFAPSYKSDE